VPVIVGCCLTAISSTSTAQLGSLNRVGTGLIFNMLAGILLVGGVFLGWQWWGVVGVAWAFVFSRSVLIIQDLFVIHLVRAGGWLAVRTWKHLGLQITIGLGFLSTALIWPRVSLWQLLPALVHGAVVSAWLLRNAAANFLLRVRSSVAPEVA